MHENTMLNRIFGSRREEVAGGWKNVVRSSVLCTLQQI
jgi:hypothetical protein